MSKQAIRSRIEKLVAAHGWPNRFTLLEVDPGNENPRLRWRAVKEALREGGGHVFMDGPHRVIAQYEAGSPPMVRVVEAIGSPGDSA